MAKQLNVNLSFTADTSKAKAQIQELYQSLNNVSTTTAKLPITTQIQEAQNAAIQLKTAMNSAFDVNTGKLDLLKFNQSSLRITIIAMDRSASTSRPTKAYL